MSLAAKRQAFATALSTVDGVKGYTAKPTTPKAGDAWPVWGGATVGEDDMQFTNRWQVVVYLPQDERAADAWIDEHANALYAAISPVAYIEGFTPANLSPNGQQYGLAISTRSE